MANLLDRLSKEDLIKVIGNMHDGIQNWNGYGFSDEDSDIIRLVSNACVGFCVDNNRDKVYQL